MTSSFSQFPANLPDRILCYYINSTAQIQQARVANIPNWLFERVLFPGQRLLFDAIPDAMLEIHTCSTLGEILLQRIPCFRLQVHESMGIPLEATKFPSYADVADLAE